MLLASTPIAQTRLLAIADATATITTTVAHICAAAPPLFGRGLVRVGDRSSFDLVHVLVNLERF